MINGSVVARRVVVVCALGSCSSSLSARSCPCHLLAILLECTRQPRITKCAASVNMSPMRVSESDCEGSWRLWKSNKSLGVLERLSRWRQICEGERSLKEPPQAEEPLLQLLSPVDLSSVPSAGEELDFGMESHRSGGFVVLSGCLRFAH